MKIRVLIVLAGLLSVMVSVPAGAGNANPPPDELMTAIDVVESLRRGTDRAAIAEQLSTRTGYDRAAALKNGMTDSEILEYLIAQSAGMKKTRDDNKAQAHKFEGNRFLTYSNYGKSAKECTLALLYTEDDYEPYRMRADAYRQYLKTFLLPAGNAEKGGDAQQAFREQRKLVCTALYADYQHALALLSADLKTGVQELNQHTNTMRNEKLWLPDDSAIVFYDKPAQRTKNTKELQGRYRMQRDLHQADVSIRKGLSEYRTLCPEEYGAEKERSRAEREKSRDKKWKKYGELAESAYFYDTSSIVPSKKSLTVVTRSEHSAFEQSYTLEKVTINCKTRKYGFSEHQIHDNSGVPVSQRQQRALPIEAKVPDSMVEKLVDEVCR